MFVRRGVAGSDPGCSVASACDTGSGEARPARRHDLLILVDDVGLALVENDLILVLDQRSPAHGSLLQRDPPLFGPLLLGDPLLGEPLLIEPLLLGPLLLGDPLLEEPLLRGPLLLGELLLLDPQTLLRCEPRLRLERTTSSRPSRLW